MSRRPLPALLVVLLGCSSPPPPSRAPARSDPPAAARSPGAGAAVATPGAPPPDASPPGSAAPDASAPAAPPPVERTGKEWPFHAWDRAEAVTFNRFAMRPGVPLRAYDEGGWSPHVVDRKAVTTAQAKKAVELLARTEGDVTVSKCPFPRHAVVLFDGDVPVASVNVCFSCGDILLWPRWSPEPDWERLTKKERAAIESRREKQLALYDRTFPQWKTFFRDEVGFAIDDAP